MVTGVSSGVVKVPIKIYQNSKIYGCRGNGGESGYAFGPFMRTDGYSFGMANQYN